MVNSTSGTMFANLTSSPDLPPLPAYTLKPHPDMIPGIPDFWTSLVLLPAVYWIMSAVFHVIDVYDFWPQYRLHAPEEITRRNHVTRYEVLRDVLIQQFFQAVMAFILDFTEPEAQWTGMEEYEIARWATRVRLAQRSLPMLLGFLGLNAATLSKNISASHPLLAGVLAGGHYPSLTTSLAGSDAVVPAFAPWELAAGSALYWLVIPGIQLFAAICFLDTWQYSLHRYMHVNKWLYTKIHSRHHRLYVPYAFGALYNHPLEGFLMDTLGAGAAYKLVGMTPRQGILFFCLGTIKTVDDHCGYAFPWDPLQHLTGNNAPYHDIHHQTWGIKTNFSQPFFIFWDRVLGTQYKGDRTDRLADKKRVAAAVKAQ